MDEENETDIARSRGRLLAMRAGVVAVLILVAVAAFAFGNANSNDRASNGGGGSTICVPGTPGCVVGESIHEHADFALFINGERFDFGQEKYISYDGEELDPNVHIHDPRHTVVHVHREHVTWDMFFQTIGFELKDTTLIGVEKPSLELDTGEVLVDGEGGTFKFYVNGVKVDGIANLEIRSMQRVLISFGTETDEQVLGQVELVTDEACIPGGMCQARGSGAGEHGEPCSGVGSCTGSR